MTKNFAYQNLILVSAVVAAPYGGRFSRSQMQLCVNCRSSNPGLEIQKNNFQNTVHVQRFDVNIINTFVAKVCEVVMGWVDFVETSVFHPEYEYVV